MPLRAESCGSRRHEEVNLARQSFNSCVCRLYLSAGNRRPVRRTGHPSRSRSGNAGRFCYGDDVAKLSDYAWLGDGKGVGARQVGQGLSNAFGLFDMHGNVWEFCYDWHGVYPSEPVIDPTGPATLHIPMKKVGRGGTWGSYRELCRSAYRSSGNNGAYSTGFRVARTFPVSDKPQADADSK